MTSSHECTDCDKTEIFEVVKAESEYVDAVCRLLGQLSSSEHTFTMNDLQNIAVSPNNRLFLLRHNNFIGGMLTICHTQSPTGNKLWIEDVVIDSSLRGRSFGRKLMEYAIKKAEEYGETTIMLTSRPSRIAANALYQSSGFSKKETNVYCIKHCNR